MTRRLLVSLPFLPLLVAADAEQQVFELFERLASALSAGNPSEFLDGFDKSMPGYQDFQANVLALMEQAELQSSLEFVRNEGTDKARSVEIDWLLQITSRYETQTVNRRREIVKCRLEKTGRRWKIIALTPATLFAPVMLRR